MTASRPEPTPGRGPAAAAAGAGFSGAAILAGTALAGLAAAAFVDARRRETEAENPPRGRFVPVRGGMRLHVAERGLGRPLVLLHGNTLMGLDFFLSGLLDMAALSYRVIVIDRPGYGYSERPRGGTIWGPEAQAEVIAEALETLDARDAIVLGHSWGAMVAAALALDRPDLVRGLVLAGGYLYPNPRLDIPLRAPAGLPVIGDVLSHTFGPLIHRAAWPAMVRLLFAPAPVTEAFRRFPAWMAFRPSQLRASAAEMGLAAPSAWRLSARYRDLSMPVSIVAGRHDRFVFEYAHSRRLAEELPEASYRTVPGAGHMIHHSAPDAVMEAIRSADLWANGRSGRRRGGAAEGTRRLN